jgi:hypothetical protein
VSSNQSAPKRPVNLNLNADLVERCGPRFGHSSAHGEALPATGMTQQEAAAEADRILTERAVDAFSALYLEHGSLSEEMQFL